jgi:hypothetical protein
MTAHIEWIPKDATTGVLRIGPPGFQYGDPYHFACTVVIEGDTAKLIGATGNGLILAGERQALREILAPMGVKSVEWERKKPDRVKMVTIKI